MAINQKRYRVIAEEILREQVIADRYWHLAYHCALALMIVTSGIFVVNEKWLRMFVFCIATVVCTVAFKQTKLVIKITSSLRLSVVPRRHNHVWREALVLRTVKLVLPFAILTLIVGLIRYGQTMEATKAPGLIIEGAAAGIALAIYWWAGKRTWYDLFFAASLYVGASFSSMNWRSFSGEISTASALIPITLILLPILYWRLDRVTARPESTTGFFDLTREYLQSTLRFNNLMGLKFPYFVMLFLSAPILLYLTVYYIPFSVDSRLGLKFFQAPVLITIAMFLLTTRNLHWRYLMLPKLGRQRQVGTLTMLTTFFVLLTSIVFWTLASISLHWLLQLSFFSGLPIRMMPFAVEVGVLLLEILVWFGLAVWLAAYLFEPRNYWAKRLNSWAHVMIPAIASSIFFSYKFHLPWLDRIKLNADRVLAPDTAPIYFATCATLIVVFTHMANRAWAKRDLYEILEKRST